MKNKWYLDGALGLILAIGCYLAIDLGLLSSSRGDLNCDAARSNAKETAAIEPSPAKSFSVPIVQKYGGVPAIEVTLNGLKVPMLFDTGASHTLLPARLAKQLKLRERGKALAETAQGKINFPTATLDRLEFGRLQVSNLNVSIAANDLSMGLLGQDVFGEYEIKISQRTIEFREIEKPQVSQEGFERY